MGELLQYLPVDRHQPGLQSLRQGDELAVVSRTAAFQRQLQHQQRGDFILLAPKKVCRGFHDPVGVAKREDFLTQVVDQYIAQFATPEPRAAHRGSFRYSASAWVVRSLVR